MNVVAIGLETVCVRNSYFSGNGMEGEEKEEPSGSYYLVASSCFFIGIKYGINV